MENVNKPQSGLKGSFAIIVILASFVVALCVFLFIMGDSSNFMGGDSNNHPLPGNYFGIIYKGGVIVPLLMTLLLLTITFSIERSFAISKAQGKGSVVNFVYQIKKLLNTNSISEAIELCNQQKGSVANVIKSALVKYQDVEQDNTMSKDQKLMAIQKEVEEATTLELPGLEQNLPILATLTQISTLFALLGTVLGMIKAFAALANAGAPDSVALATGISEALINTAFGIGIAALAVISYNFFTSKIDKLTYSIDEAGFSIVQSYAANHK